MANSILENPPGELSSAENQGGVAHALNKMRETRVPATCPKCGQTYTAPPALSRDNATLICPDCGTREALDSIGVTPFEQDMIIDTIHRCQRQ